MSHEVRTPLNAVIGFAQLLQHDAAFSSTQHKSLEAIRRGGEHLLDLINDVLEISKIEAGRAVVQPSRFDLHQLLETLESMFHMRAAQQGLRLCVDVDTRVPRYIRSDERKVRQVLINLLANAIKFTEEGTVTLRVQGMPEAEPSPDSASPVTHLRFEVEDTGPGVDEEEVAVIFEAFGQGRNGRLLQEGTGLGLAISKRFVEMLGGQLHLTSHPGSGSLFAFDVPLTNTGDDEHAPESRRTVQALAPGQPPYRILIVEDEAASRALLVHLLTRVGFEVHTATNGEEGVAACQAWPPDLILMDIRMPVMNGYEATRQIKASLQGKAPVIIALTAYAFEEDRRSVLEAGCDDFIQKPLREEILFELLGTHLGVRYLYDGSEATGAEQAAEIDEAQAHAIVRKMPSDWVEAVRAAAMQADDTTLRALLDQVRSEQAALVHRLLVWVNTYQFEPIIGLMQGPEMD
jgi:two-component system sensor histidine kinase/response regulator